jgi:hypothetical protein
MTIKELYRLLGDYVAGGDGDKLVVVSKIAWVETWDTLNEIIDGHYEGGRFTYDPDAEDGGGCNAIWLAESL